MEDQTPQQQQSITAEGLKEFYAEFGMKAHTVHELAAQLGKMQTIGQQLLEQHAPGKCQPIAPPTDGGEAVTDEPTPLKSAGRRGG